MNLVSWVINAWINVHLDSSALIAQVLVIVLTVQHATQLMELVTALPAGLESIALKGNVPTEVLVIIATKVVNVKWKTQNCVIHTMENVTVNLVGAVQLVIVLVHS